MTMAEAVAVPDVSEAAGTYDNWFDRPWGRYAFAVEGDAIDAALNTQPGTRVVDVGCGTGRFARRAEQDGAGVVLLDLDPMMVAVATSHARGPRVVADAHALPLRDGAADAAVAITLLEFTADPATVMAELARITRPGGRIVVGALNPTSLWGCAHRHELRAGTWCDARFLTRRQLRTLGGAHGRVQLRGVLFAPAVFPGLRWLGPLLEPLIDSHPNSARSRSS